MGSRHYPEWFEDQARKLFSKLKERTSNQEALLVMCQAWAVYCEAQEVLSKEGRLTMDQRTGLYVPHPCVKIEQQAYDQYTKLGKLLGLFTKANEATKDELTEWMSND